MPNFKHQKNWTALNRADLGRVLALGGTVKEIATLLRRGVEDVNVVIVRHALALGCITAALIFALSMVSAYYSSNGLAGVAAVVAFAVLTLAWHFAVDPWSGDEP